MGAVQNHTTSHKKIKTHHDYTKEEFQNIIVEAMPQRPQRVHEMSKEKLAFTFFFGLISRMTMVCV